MASFQAPPGHLSQAEVLIISSLVEFQLTVNAPDPDLKVFSGKQKQLAAWQLVAFSMIAWAAGTHSNSRRPEGAGNASNSTLW